MGCTCIEHEDQVDYRIGVDIHSVVLSTYVVIISDADLTHSRPASYFDLLSRLSLYFQKINGVGSPNIIPTNARTPFSHP